MPTGENFQQTMPTVSITDGTLTTLVTGTDSNYDYTTDNGTVTKLSMHASKYDEAIPAFTGTVTVTITAPSGTQVHYTLSGKNPTYKAIAADGTKAPLPGSTLKYTAPFTIVSNKPGKTHYTVLKLRSYALNGTTVKPNDHSRTLVVRFNITPS